MRPAYTEKAPQGEDTSAAEQKREFAAADLISRQAAIDALEREKSLVERPITETRWFDLGLRKAQDVLSELPSAQPEQKTGEWTPMSEGPPKEDGKYLCCWQGKTVDTGYFLNGHFRLYGENKDKLITAWMPLPDPYKEEEYGG